MCLQRNIKFKHRSKPSINVVIGATTGEKRNEAPTLLAHLLQAVSPINLPGKSSGDFLLFS